MVPVVPMVCKSPSRQGSGFPNGTVLGPVTKEWTGMPGFGASWMALSDGKSMNIHNCQIIFSGKLRLFHVDVSLPQGTVTIIIRIVCIYNNNSSNSHNMICIDMRTCVYIYRYLNMQIHE